MSRTAPVDLGDLERLSSLGGETLPRTKAEATRLITRRVMWIGEPASDRQKARLRWLGHQYPTERLTKRQASSMLDGLITVANTAGWENWKSGRRAGGVREIPYSWELDAVFGPSKEPPPDGPTRNQIEYLASLGSHRLPPSKWEASELIDILKDKGLASDRVQARLKFNGYPGPFFPLPAEEASSALSAAIAKSEKPGEWEAWKQKRVAGGLRDVPYPWDLDQTESGRKPNRNWGRILIRLLPVAAVSIICYAVWRACVWVYTSGVLAMLAFAGAIAGAVWLGWRWDKAQKSRRRAARESPDDGIVDP